VTGALVSAALAAVALLVVGSVVWTYMRTGVPPVPARAAEARDVVALLAEGGVATDARIYELGCGWGTLAIAIARAYPRCCVIGIERSWLPWLVSALRARRVPNLAVRRADFFREDLSRADAVVSYLMIRPMAPLAEKLDRELRPGTPVVALTFWFRDRRPVDTRSGRGLRGDAALYRWLPPGRG
jgi:cyclopropane fatty-acyl-phospholipid synthase-like methyltransferase